MTIMEEKVVTNGHAEPRVVAQKAAVSLREAIELVNKHKDKLGDDLVLEITQDGFLSGMVEYGRNRVRKSGAEAGAQQPARNGDL